MPRLKSDKYKSARGGPSRVLDLSCNSCGAHIANYQKDGPGMLKRLYLDRIREADLSDSELVCKACGRHLGTKYIYEKEQRPAYRLFVGAVVKKIVKKD